MFQWEIITAAKRVDIQLFVPCSLLLTFRQAGSPTGEQQICQSIFFYLLDLHTAHVFLLRPCDHPIERVEAMWRLSLKNVDVIFRDAQVMANRKRYRQQACVDEEMIGL